MHRSLSRSPLATLGSMAGLALALSACADPVAPSLDGGATAVAAVGTDNSQPFREQFGTGMQVSGGRDQRIDVCEQTLGGGGCTVEANFWEAYVLTRHPRWAPPIAGTQWVGPRADADNYFSEPRGDDVYQTTFELPAGATNPTLNIQLYADNRASIYVNGVLIGAQPTGDHYPNYGCTDPTVGAMTCSSFGPSWNFTTSGNAVSVPWITGTNTLRIVVSNEEFKQGCANVPNSPNCQSATGLDFLAQIRYGLAGNQGCTPGYWKQAHHHDSWMVYSPSQSVGSVFANAGAYAGISLDAALDLGGGPGVDGGRRILLRAAVAALLNASSTGVAYQLTTEQVISQVSAALGGTREAMLSLASTLDTYNNRGCPLN